MFSPRCLAASRVTIITPRPVVEFAPLYRSQKDEITTQWAMKDIERVGLLRGRPAYCSFDIDAVDPAYAPATGTPEVGGLTSYEALSLVRGLRGLDLVGADVVEVAPPYDHAEVTAILAHRTVMEAISALGAKRR